MSLAAEPKRLYRSRKQKTLSGVCGGVAEYFDIDPTWVRLIGAVLALMIVLFNGVFLPLILVAGIYGLGLLIIPAAPENLVPSSNYNFAPHD
jgi:phage shock protein C